MEKIKKVVKTILAIIDDCFCCCMFPSKFTALKVSLAAVLLLSTGFIYFLGFQLHSNIPRSAVQHHLQLAPNRSKPFVPVLPQRVRSRKYQKVLECGCKRRFFFKKPMKNRLLVRLNSTCSDESSFYQQGQKVVSFSYHEPNQDKTKGSLRIFKRGILKNLIRIRRLYPGFVVRIYTDVGLKENKDLCAIVCNNPDIQWCDITATPSHGDLSEMYFMTWRFLPLGDPTVKILLSRDLDSLISQREASAVYDWLQNVQTRSIMVIHDHPQHNFPVMGGTWGAHNFRLGRRMSTKLQTQMVSLLADSPDKERIYTKGFDQSLLLMAIDNNWDQVVNYDSYFCNKEWKKGILVKPFKKQRRNGNDFVGNPNMGGGNWTLPPCPVECRPSFGTNWTYC